MSEINNLAVVETLNNMKDCVRRGAWFEIPDPEAANLLAYIESLEEAVKNA